MPYFKADSHQINEGCVLITDEEAHHISKVLRMKPGESLNLHDGIKTHYEGKIISIGKTVRVENLKKVGETEPPHPLHLFLGLLKGQKMELIIQKAVELNLASITPIQTRFSIGKIEKESKLSRFEKIATEAQKQCGRIQPLKINPALHFEEAIQKQKNHPNIFCAEKGEYPPLFKLKLSDKSMPINFWIGPEGGWHEDEVALAEKTNFTLCSLGNLILRVETAALHAASILIGKIQGVSC